MIFERNWEKDWEMCQGVVRPPWKVDKDSEGRYYVYTDTGIWIEVGYAPSVAQFIAQAREALPYWLQRVRELEEQLKTQMSQPAAEYATEGEAIGVGGDNSITTSPNPAEAMNTTQSELDMLEENKKGKHKRQEIWRMYGERR